MTKRILLFFVLLSFVYRTKAQDLKTPFEDAKGQETTTYAELIKFYEELERVHGTICMKEAGSSDAYYPLQVVYYSSDHKFDINNWKKDGKVILLINNGIHPGEPDGIDACMLLLRDAAEGRITIPNNIVLAVIPVFNIGGMLNRGRSSRANQNGPDEYGFRGSAQNLDLNRDFIKLDAKETRSLVKLFHQLDPDIFIDNHVSDGADYQHIMTLLATQHDKLGGIVGEYSHGTFEPLLYKEMKKHHYDMVPYVNDFDKTPDKGWTEFYDPPRFSSGFAALFQTLAFVPETHMLKPFDKRVQATYELMRSCIKVASKQASAIHEAREQERQAVQRQTAFTLNWKPDTTVDDSVFFKGYEGKYKPSEVSGLPRLYYDHNSPFERYVPFYNHFVPEEEVKAPQAYIIKQGWQNVINRLKWNGVEMERLYRDTILQVSVYHIKDFETGKGPYEGHYMHKNVRVIKETAQLKLLKGDYYIPSRQAAKRYLIETLEPRAPDAFFAWGLFDAILQEKEYYSDYVFEDVAAKLLKADPKLQQALENKRKAEPAFAKDASAQLDWVYKHSSYYEPEHMRYPVFRVE